MTLDELAATVLDACDSEGIAHMLTGAFATSFYGVPRSTSDVDLVVAAEDSHAIRRAIARLSDSVRFDPQVQFDTLTWGKRSVGTTTEPPPLTVELFELFDDPFVREQFSRRRSLWHPGLGRTICLPTPEDAIIQKIRWGRAKDLDDARDMLAVQGFDTLDMERIERWCGLHGNEASLRAVEASARGLA